MPEEITPPHTPSVRPQETLEASEVRYQRLFEAARDGILLLDAHTSKITDSNPAMTELLGYSRQELIGKELADLGGVEDRDAAHQKMTQLLRDGSIRTEDLSLVSKSGQPRSVEVVGSVYAEGERRVIQCNVRDLSARDQPQTANADTELQYRSLADAIPQPVWTALPDGTLDYFNERWYEYTGMARTNINEEVWNGIIHPDEQETLRGVWIHSVQNGEPYDMEVRVRHAATGNYRWFLSKAVPIRDQAGDIVRWVGTNTDIHDLKRYQQELQASEKRYGALTEALPAFIWTAQPDGVADYFNERWYAYTGMARSNIGTDVWMVIHPNDRAPTGTAWGHSLATGDTFQVEQRLREASTGQYRWFLVRALPVSDETGKITQWVGTTTDIHDIKRYQQEIQESEARFRTVANAAPIKIWMSDVRMSLIWFNQRWLDFTGLPMEQMLDGRWAQLIHPDDLARVKAAFADHYATQTAYSFEYRMRRHDGEFRWCVVAGVPRFLPDGTFDGFIGTCLDISNQKVASDALQESEARFRALADNIAQLAWMADGTGWIFWYNRRWHEYTGTTLEEMQGWGWQNVHHPDYIAPVTQRWTEHLSAGREWEDTFPLRGKDGEWRWFLSRAFPIRDEAGNVTLWFGTNTDITEQRETEEALRRHQAEIEGLNVRLARAMQETHHRVKNNLQLIAAIVEMQADELGSGGAVQRIKQHVRALAAIHDLLTQQAKADTNTSSVNAKAVLQNLVPMLQATTGDRHIKAEVEDVLLPVQKATSLALLVSECVSNAIKHATGEVEITLDVEGNAARLEVCDDGPGFPPGFNPRKAAHTGLELIDSTARWDLRGEVHYENQGKGGGRVVVTFPLDASTEP